MVDEPLTDAGRVAVTRSSSGPAMGRATNSEKVELGATISL